MNNKHVSAELKASYQVKANHDNKYIPFLKIIKLHVYWQNNRTEHNLFIVQYLNACTFLRTKVETEVVELLKQMHPQDNNE